MKKFLYPLLGLYRSLAFLITRGVADKYDHQGLANPIAEGDMRLWRSGLQSNCPFVKRVFEGWSLGRHGFDMTLSGFAKWFVVEAPALATSASRTLSETGIEFGSRIEQVNNQTNQFGLVQVSSSLQCTNNPSAFLNEILGLNPEYLVFEKLVLTQMFRGLGQHTFVVKRRVA